MHDKCWLATPGDQQNMIGYIKCNVALKYLQLQVKLLLAAKVSAKIKCTGLAWLELGTLCEEPKLGTECVNVTFEWKEVIVVVYCMRTKNW